MIDRITTDCLFEHQVDQVATPHRLFLVTRKWFTGMIARAPPEITVPAGAAQLTDLESRSMLWLFVTGRLNVGESIEQASAQLQTFWPRLLEDAVPTQSIGPRRQSFLAM
jgi:hypothetical protein